ncbi:MAG: hypothetical protein NT013_25980 [Planctomycetia bacterium]|nr:hypothetical protein [Planctomycetia bacterium]
MGLTVMVNVVVKVSTPPPVVPPLSCSWTVTVAVPLAFVAGVTLLFIANFLAEF